MIFSMELIIMIQIYITLLIPAVFNFLNRSIFFNISDTNWVYYNNTSIMLVHLGLYPRSATVTRPRSVLAA